MIRDSIVLSQLRPEWQTVLKSRDFVKRQLAASSFGIGSIGPSHEFRNFAHSLNLLFAYSVLEHTLLQLRDEGTIKSKSSNLGPLMAASRSVLDWQDFSKIDAGRQRRNEMAHQQMFLERAECWEYIDSLESELKAWSILP